MELPKLDGTNPWLQTKRDLDFNLKTVERVYTLLRALAVGAEVEIGGQYYLMVDGHLFVKGINWDTKTQEITPTLLGVSHFGYNWLLKTTRSIPTEQWEKIKAEMSMKLVVNYPNGGTRNL